MMSPMSADTRSMTHPRLRWRRKSIPRASRVSGRKRPFGISLLIVVQLLVGLSMLIGATWGFSLSVWADSPEGREELLGRDVGLPPEAVSGVTFLLGIAYLVLFVSALLLARGYMKGRPWARRRGMMVALFGILSAVLAILVLPGEMGPDHPVWSIVFNLTVFLYLGGRTARAYFRNGG